MKGIWRCLALLIGLVALANPIPASAHPELVFYIDTAATVHMKNNRLWLDYYIAKSDQFAFSELALAKGGLPGYAEEECDAAKANFKVSTGDFSVPFERRFASAVEKFPGTGAGVWVWCRFVSDVEFYEEISFSWSDSNYLDTPGHREFNIGLGSSPSLDLTDYGKVQVLLRELDSEFQFDFPPEKLAVEPVAVATQKPVVAEEEVLEPELPEVVKEEKSWLTELSDTYFRSINPSASIVFIGIVLSLILGAFHSIAPGHGKSIMAVLALAERGKRREINRLGLTMGATHTFGVFTLGAIFIFGSKFVPASIIPTLGLISGFLIVLIGSYYLIRFIRHRNQHSSGAPHHHHEPVSSGRIALLGVVGGMVPTPTALTVLVGTAALGSAWYGVLLVTSYGVGMTIVLIFAGRIVERLYRFAEGMTGSNRGIRVLVDFAPALAAAIQLLAGFFLVTISYGALI